MRRWPWECLALHDVRLVGRDYVCRDCAEDETLGVHHREGLVKPGLTGDVCGLQCEE